MKNTTNYKLKKPEGNDEVSIDDFNHNADILDTEIKKLDNSVKSLENNKVDKIAGKGLSSNDFTNTYKNNITDNRNFINSHATAINANTANITANANNITANTTNISNNKRDIANHNNLLINHANTINNHINSTNIHVTSADRTRLDNTVNPNLLINSDFKIWQRGESIPLYTSRWSYTADRWICRGNGGVIKDVKGLKASGNIEVNYIIEEEGNFIGQHATLSYSLNNQVKLLYSTTIAGRVVFSLTLNHNDVLNWVKLEMGTIQTPYRTTLYGDELRRCQRYYQSYITKSEQAIKSTIFSTKFVAPFSIPKMRIFPRITTKDINAYVSYGIVPVTYDGAPYSSDSYLNLWFSNPSYPAPTEGYIINKATDETGGIFLDAEIY